MTYNPRVRNSSTSSLIIEADKIFNPSGIINIEDPTTITGSLNIVSSDNKSATLQFNNGPGYNGNLVTERGFTFTIDGNEDFKIEDTAVSASTLITISNNYIGALEKHKIVFKSGESSSLFSLVTTDGAQQPQIYLTDNNNTNILNINFNTISLTNRNLLLSSGNGISFNSTTPDAVTGSSGSVASELLDDYEEGTWTPVFTPGTYTYDVGGLDGSYVKIGNLVMISCTLSLLSGSGGSSAVSISGLPFTPYNVGTLDYPVSIRCENLDGDANPGLVNVIGWVDGSTGAITLRKTRAIYDSVFGVLASYTNVLQSNLVGTSPLIYLCGVYRTA